MYVFFSSFDMFKFEVKVFDIFWKNWIGLLDEQRRQQEAELQKALLETSNSTNNDDDVSARIFPRIKRISAAARAFLDHNRQLTLFSSNPIIRKLELDMARRFVRSFQSMEHEIRHTTLRVSLEEWCEQNFRDELGKMASEDVAVYQMLAFADTLPTHRHKHAVEQISNQLMCGHKQKKAQQQME